MGDLTKNFSWNEFNHSKLVPNYYIPRTGINLWGIDVLCNNIMQPVRNFIGESITITSGLRDEAIYRALKNAGYPASATSDHFFWCKLNPTGSGACDFTWKNFRKNHKKVFNWMIKNLEYNQVILYPDNNFIHVSNPRNEIFKYVISSRRPVLIYKDGKYQSYKARRT